jgi:hypothetical protein
MQSDYYDQVYAIASWCPTHPWLDSIRLPGQYVRAQSDVSL